MENSASRTIEKQSIYYYYGGKTPAELEPIFADIIRDLQKENENLRYTCRINIVQMFSKKGETHV